MDRDLAYQLLVGVLRTKRAVEAFLALHPGLSLENPVDQNNLFLAARESVAKQKKSKKVAKAGLITTRDSKRALVQNWDKVLHTAKTLALCSLPHEPVKGTRLVRKATMEDGTTVHVMFSAHDETIELPYGKDRALITWLMTIARNQNNPRVEFDSAMDFLEVFGLQKNGRMFANFKAAMARICNVTITYGYSSDTANTNRDKGEKLVFDRNLPQRSDYGAESLGLRYLPGIRDPYFIEFGSRTFQDLVSNPVSVPLEILKRYQNAPVLWDFIQFISYQAADLDEGQQKAFPLEMMIPFLGTTETSARKIRYKIAGLLNELGDFMSNVDLIGQGSGSVLIIQGLPKTLSDSSPTPIDPGEILNGDIVT